RRIHASLDDEPYPVPALPPDSLGFSSAYAHRFRAAYQGQVVTNDAGASGVLHGFELQGELMAMPGLPRPGRFRRTFTEGSFSEIRFRGAFGPQGIDEARIWSTATFFGEYSQSYHAAPGAWLTGSGGYVGLASALEFNQRSTLNRRDQLSAA